MDARNKPSPMTKEVFEYLNATSVDCIPQLLDGLADNQKLDALMTAASCEQLFYVKKKGLPLPVFAHGRARILIKKLAISGVLAHPFFGRMVDLSFIGETREEKIDSAAKLISFCLDDLDHAALKMMIAHGEKNVPGFLYEMVDSQGQDHPASLASTLIRTYPRASELFPDGMEVLPIVAGNMNLLEYTALFDSKQGVDTILAKYKHPAEALAKMGNHAVEKLFSTPDLALDKHSSVGEILAKSAMKMIAAGAILTEDQWQKIVEIKIRPDEKTASFRMPFIVARYIEPDDSGVILTRMIEEGGLSPDWSLHNKTTLLHAAVKSGNLDTVKAVLAAGANPTLVDRKNRTPGDIAREGADPETIRLLDAATAKAAMMGIANAAKAAMKAVTP